MQNGRNSTILDFFCRNHVFYLAFFWIVSIAVGIFLGTKYDFSAFPLMHASILRRVSIVGLTAILILPILLSAIAVHVSLPYFIYLIASVKGICYGFCICFLVKYFGSAGWLVRLLVLFSDSCMLVPLFLFWIRQLRGSEKQLGYDTVCCALIGLLIGTVDYFVISPLAFTLIEIN